ncbi:MAG: DUF1820 family protein [Pseudomonadales bacterium]
MSKSPVYRVVFVNHNKVYELYAKAIFQSDMYGFIEIEDFIFGERAQVIVDPSEEKLKNEFAGVKRTYVPMHNVLRIDEVEKEGTGKIRDAGSSDKVTAFPLMGSRPLSPSGDSGE